MNKINNGGPAFPIIEPEGCTGAGMSLRDYFAAQALIGLLSFPGISGEQYGPADEAKLAYEWADALLSARMLEGGAA